MKSRLYCVYDRVAEEGGPPFIAKNDGVAARQFNLILQKVGPQSQNEYKLYFLGTFDSAKMQLEVNVDVEEVVVQQIDGQVALAVPGIGRVIE